MSLSIKEKLVKILIILSIVSPIHRTAHKKCNTFSCLWIHVDSIVTWYYHTFKNSNCISNQSQPENKFFSKTHHHHLLYLNIKFRQRTAGEKSKFRDTLRLFSALIVFCFLLETTINKFELSPSFFHPIVHYQNIFSAFFFSCDTSTPESNCCKFKGKSDNSWKNFFQVRTWVRMLWCLYHATTSQTSTDHFYSFRLIFLLRNAIIFTDHH